MNEIPRPRGLPYLALPAELRAIVEDGLTVSWIDGQTEHDPRSVFYEEVGLVATVSRGGQTMTTWWPDDDPDIPRPGLEDLLDFLIAVAAEASYFEHATMGDLSGQKDPEPEPETDVDAVLGAFTADMEELFGAHSKDALALSVDDEGVAAHPMLKLLAQTADVARRLRVETEIKEILGTSARPVADADGPGLRRLLGDELMGEVLKAWRAASASSPKGSA